MRLGFIVWNLINYVSRCWAVHYTFSASDSHSIKATGVLRGVAISAEREGHV